MEKNTDCHIPKFKIVFSNQVIEINYNISLKENKVLKIESLIKQALDHIDSKPLHKTPKDYIFFCYCGKQLDPKKLLSESICSHECQEKHSLSKNKNGLYLLIEKEDDENMQIISKENKRNEINKIFQKIHDNFSKTDNIIIKLKIIKSKIKEFLKQKERGDKILDKYCDVYYNEEYYNDLIEIGIDKNKTKAALRYAKNDKEKALFFCIDSRLYFDDKYYLFYDNKDVLTKGDFKKLCYEEILKELPYLKGKEELDNLFIHLIQEIKINKYNNN